MTSEERAMRAALSRIEVWSRAVLGRPLRPYQAEPAAAVLASVAERRGDTITVMMSRQAGKNELSAHLESFLLARYQRRAESIVKAAPTFKPQTVNSMLRLATLLDNPITRKRWTTEHGYIIRLGRARALFFSAGPDAQVVGATASLLLEIDEAQDVAIAKHDKDFAPMAASTNATRVYWGTAWDETTLLQRQIEANLAAEKRDGRRRHFAYPWEVVARYNPAYGRYVEGERARLGADHPLYRTQYELRTIAGETGFFSPAHRAQLAGFHPRRTSPLPDATYIAAVDVAGGLDHEDLDHERREKDSDSTVLLIARVEWREVGEYGREPELYVEQAYTWRGLDLRTQYQTLLDLCRNVWPVRRLLVDATGLGRGLTDFLGAAFPPELVVPFVFTTASKSNLGYDLLAAVAAGRLKWYGHGEDDGEARELWHQVEECRYSARSNRLMAWGVPESRGHDDFLSALGLLVEAGKQVTPPAAASLIPAIDPYDRRLERSGGYS